MKRKGEDSNAANEAAADQRVETPVERARRDGGEELQLHRWTDAELKQRAGDLGIGNADKLSRQQLIERLGGDR